MIDDANFIERIYIYGTQHAGKMSFAFLKENGDFQAGSFIGGNEKRAAIYALYYALQQFNPMMQTNIITSDNDLYAEFLDLKIKKEKFVQAQSRINMDIWFNINNLIKLRYDNITIKYDFDTGRDWMQKVKRFAEKAVGK